MGSTIRSTINYKLIELKRQEHGLTLKGLGKVLGVTEQTMHGICIGRRGTPTHRLVKLAKLFNVPLEDLATNPDPSVG